MLLTARYNTQRTTTKIHLANCGSVPVNFDVGDDSWGVNIIELDGKEGRKIPFKLYHSGSNWWMQPLSPKVFCVAILHVAKHIRGHKGSDPSVCAMCKSYEVIKIKYKDKGWWLEVQEAYK